MDFRRWHDRGRIWRVRPTSVGTGIGASPRLGKAERAPACRRSWPFQRLVPDDRPAPAGRAQDRAAVPLLIDVLGDRSNPLARVHALWALVALDGLNAIILNGLMGDPHPGLREQALRAAAVVERADPKQQIATSILARWPTIRRSVFDCRRRRGPWAIVAATTRSPSPP